MIVNNKLLYANREKYHLPVHPLRIEQSNLDKHCFFLFAKSQKTSDFRVNVPDNFVKDFVKDFVKANSREILEKLTERQWVILVIIASDSTVSAKDIS